MKKIYAVMILFLAVMSVFAAEKGVTAGFWYNCPQKSSRTDINGLGLGVPIMANKDMNGVSVALLGNHSGKVNGFQWALIGFNYAETLYGTQLALANIAKGNSNDCVVQIGAYNKSAENGIQIGLVNDADNNAKFQLGLLNFNKNGLLPFMVFINFSNDLFD